MGDPQLMNPQPIECVLGIDPGLMGALAFLNPRDASLIGVIDMPTIRVTKTRKEYDVPEIVQYLTDVYDPVAAFIEKVGAMPGQGVTSMFRFGMGYGLLTGIVHGLGVPITHVRPRTWQGKMLRDAPKGTKGASIMRAKELWPRAPLVTPRGRLIDGRADAMLLARYGILHEMAPVS